jgi:YVTN family beta-propeller protein
LFSNRLVPDASFDVENVPVGQDIIFAFQRHFIDFDETGQRVFTANSFLSNSVSIINLTNSNNVTNVPVFPSGGVNPNGVVFDEAGQRVFTPNLGGSVSIIDLANSNNVTTVPLAGAFFTFSLLFDEAGQRLFTANEASDSVSIVDLTNANNVTNIPLLSSGGNGPRTIAFDAAGSRVFTANVDSSSVSIIDLTNSNNITNVPLAGGVRPAAITFDVAGQRVFTANVESNSLSIIDLANSNNVINVPLGVGGDGPVALVFDEPRQRVITANVNSNSISIIDLANSNNVINVPLLPSGGINPVAMAFDEAGQRVFTANAGSDSVSIVDLLSLPTVAKICQDSGFDTGDIRTFVSGQQTLEQITCVNFVGECSGNIANDETRECTVEDYIVDINEISNSEILTVIKNTECQADNQTCEQNPIQPSNFTVVIEGNNPSQNNFPGSSIGTHIELEPGAYNVTEQGLDPTTPAICTTMGFEAGQVVSPDTSGLFICTNFSDECEGDITIGTPQTCTIDNVLVKLNFLDLAVANSGSDNVSILLGNGTGTFVTPATNFAAGTSPRFVAVGDFN